MRKQHIFVTVDAVVFQKEKNKIQILLIQRKNPPFQNQWALPGGFVEDDEDLETAVTRELFEETGIVYSNFKQLKSYGKPERDPRGRTISVAFVGFSEEKAIPIGADDAKEAKWFAIDNLPKLAFDHDEIIGFAISHFLLSHPE